jgi:hypothetical protein
MPGEDALARVSGMGTVETRTSPRRSPKDTEAASGIVTPATAIPFAVRYQRASKAQSEVNSWSEL